MRRGQDGVHAPGLVTNLDAQPGGNIEPALTIHPQTLRATPFPIIGLVEVEITLPVSERSVRSGLSFDIDTRHLIRGRGDFDADGYDDLSFSSYPADGTSDLNAYLWFGWDIPWDEPRWW